MNSSLHRPECRVAGYTNEGQRGNALRTAALFLLRLFCSVLYERLTVRCNHSALEDDGETENHGDQALEPLFMDL